MSLRLREQIYFWNKKPEFFFWAAFTLSVFLLFSPQGGVAEEKLYAGAVAAREGAFMKIVLEARAAIVLNAKTKQTLFEKKASERLPLASLTKIMTAATALSLVPETTLIPIGMSALVEEGDSGLKAGDEWLLRDLLQLTLLGSSNDGAHAVAAAVGEIARGTAVSGEKEETGRLFFVERMNEEAHSLGFSSLSFRNETGLDISPALSGGDGSARDVALLLSRVLSRNPEIFEPTRRDNFMFGSGNGNELRAQNTNRETERFPLLLASKTGYTDLAGGNLALAFDAGFNNPLIIIVLGSTYEGRFTDAEKLVWAALAYMAGAR